MNEYDVFCKVREHLLTQMAKATDFDVCRYRAPDGKRCAVGCLIKDEFYTPDLEGLPTDMHPVCVALEQSGVPITPHMIEILNELQWIHDQHKVTDWKQELNDLADKYFQEKDYAEPMADA